jgi:hypothetical protein
MVVRPLLLDELFARPHATDILSRINQFRATFFFPPARTLSQPSPHKMNKKYSFEGIAFLFLFRSHAQMLQRNSR